ncbi:hypothetical protein [Modestobacter versicolor]|uniref:hypothetical protein n=1 Tax=Modestobacter versicolor TaxID=429133 RepID=UPI0034DEE6A9
MSHLISVQLEVLGGLLAELRGLAGELTEEERGTAGASRSLAGALAGPVGEEAALAGGQWNAALTTLAARTLAVAASLDAALAAYRAADLGLAGQLSGAGRVGDRAVPR